MHTKSLFAMTLLLVGSQQLTACTIVDASDDTDTTADEPDAATTSDDSDDTSDDETTDEGSTLPTLVRKLRMTATIRTTRTSPRTTMMPALPIRATTQPPTRSKATAETKLMHPKGMQAATRRTPKKRVMQARSMATSINTVRLGLLKLYCPYSKRGRVGRTQVSPSRTWVRRRTNPLVSYHAPTRL